MSTDPTRPPSPAVDDYEALAAELMAGPEPVAAVGSALEARDRMLDDMSERLNDIGEIVGAPADDDLADAVEKLSREMGDASAAFGYTQDENKRLRAALAARGATIADIRARAEAAERDRDRSRLSVQAAFRVLAGEAVPDGWPVELASDLRVSIRAAEAERDTALTRSATAERERDEAEGRARSMLAGQQAVTRTAERARDNARRTAEAAEARHDERSRLLSRALARAEEAERERDEARAALAGVVGIVEEEHAKALRYDTSGVGSTEALLRQLGATP